MAETKSRLISGAFTATGDVKEENIDNLIDQTIEPETLNFAVDVREAGHAPNWLWSWDPTSLPYARIKITLSAESEVPIYKKGTYRLDNFAAFNTNGSATQTHKIFLKWIDEPGTNNLVDWVTYDSGTYTFAGVADSAQRAQRLTWTVPEEFDIPTLNTSTVNYNIAQTANAYVYSGTQVGNNPAIGPLRRGNTYNFILDSSTAGHPFYLHTDLSGTNYSAGQYNDEYTNGVTNSRAVGSAGTDATLTFTVPNDAPDTLMYQCGNHASMRNQITIKDLAVDTNNDGEYVLYFQHSQEGHNTPANVRNVPAIQSQMCLTYDATKGKFIPQDLRQYMEKTTVFKNKITEEIERLSINETTFKNFLKNKNIIDSAETFTGGGSVDSAAVSSIISSDRSTLIDSDYVISRLGLKVENHTTLQQEGTLTVTTGTARWYAPRDIELTKMRAHVKTAPTGSGIGIRVNKNGSSIKTLSITQNTTNQVENLSPTLSMNEGDYLTVDVTSVGSGTAGSDLDLIIRYK